MRPGRQVGVDGLFQQALLFCCKCLGLGRELQPFENRHLVRELVDGGPVECCLAFVTLDGSALARELGHHRANRLAQLLRAERLELGLVNHGE